MPFPKQIERLGRTLYELGKRPELYAGPPPLRAIQGAKPLAEPRLGLGALRILEGAVPQYYQNSLGSVGYLSTLDDGKFIKAHHLPDKFRAYYDKEYPGRRPLPDAEEFTEIDSMGGAGPAGGTAEYIVHWGDDEAAGHRNVSTVLTPINKARRPINWLQFQMRQPEAAAVLPYRSELDALLPQGALFESLDPTERLGALAMVNLAQQRAQGVNGAAAALAGLRGDELTERAKAVAEGLRRVDLSGNGPLSAFGAQTLIRNELLRRLFAKPEDAATIDELLARKVFKRSGGRV